ncbi:MAG: LamG-like jellyroll fold domain-containing protein, partial [Limisphaerales bacterium]
GGTGQWWAGKGLLDGEETGTVDDFGLTLVGGQAGFGIGNPDTTVTSQTAINDSRWHHVAATRDATSGQMLLYIDGTLEAGTYGPTGTKAAPSSLRIGSIQAGYAGGYLAGTVDDVQLFQRVFAASEIGLLMNHPPVLAPVPDALILAGRTLMITNRASDPDQPAETLRWSLVNPPPGAGINATTGLFAWRPAVESSPATNGVTVVVSDNGTPNMSATQVFSVLVARPTAPGFTGPVWSNGLPMFTVSGDDGPDYIIEAANTLILPVDWLTVATNQSASPPFDWTDLAATNFNQRFYRVRLGP